MQHLEEKQKMSKMEVEVQTGTRERVPTTLSTTLPRIVCFKRTFILNMLETDILTPVVTSLVICIARQKIMQPKRRVYKPQHVQHFRTCHHDDSAQVGPTGNANCAAGVPGDKSDGSLQHMCT